MFDWAHLGRIVVYFPTSSELWRINDYFFNNNLYQAYTALKQTNQEHMLETEK